LGKIRYSGDSLSSQSAAARRIERQSLIEQAAHQRHLSNG
jgi:hypothetical protein